MKENTENKTNAESGVNPRLRSTQRVRAVPYECCGGMCSFLNSGCFAMCCGGTKTKKKSVVKKKNSNNGAGIKRNEVSETPKKLIRPDSTDGITEIEQNAFDDNFSRDASNTPILNRKLNDEKDSAYSLTDYDLSVHIDEVCEGGENDEKHTLDGNKDSACSLSDYKLTTVRIEDVVNDEKNNFLKGEEISQSDSKLSDPKFDSSDIGTPNKNASGALDKSWKLDHHSSSPSFFEKGSNPSESEEVENNKNDSKESKKNTFFSKIPFAKGKKNEENSGSQQKKEVDESDTIRISKVTTLGTTSNNVSHNVKQNEGKKQSNTNDSEDKGQIPEKKSFLKKITTLKKMKKVPSDKDMVETKSNSISMSENSTQESEMSKSTSKKSFLGKLTSSKSRITPENENKQTSSKEKVKKNKTLFGSMKKTQNVETTKIVKSNDAMKNEEREKSPIKIVRNDFFPAEVRSNDSNSYSNKRDDDASKSEVKKIEDESENNVAIDKEPNIEKGEIFPEDNDEIPILQNVNILPTMDSPSLTAVSLPEIPKKFQNISEDSQSDAFLGEGIFHTSCRLSIKGSMENIEAQENLLNQEKNEILEQESVNSSTVDNLLEESTDTLTESKIETNNEEWIEIPHEEIDEKTLDYIYESTLKSIESNEIQKEVIENQSDMSKEEQLSEKSCEKCGKIFEENEMLRNESVKCICGTLTRVRPSVAELEEGNVKNKVAAFSQKEHSIIIPLDWKKSTESLEKDDVIISEAHSSPTLGTKSGNKSATPSPIITAKSRSATLSSTNSDWQNAEEDIDRLMVMQGRSSLSSLGLRSDSMASVYSGAGEGRYGTVTVKGQVEFGLQYNYKAGDLEIHVKQCKDLAPVDIKRNRSDPYVKVYLLPDKSKSGKRKTKVKKHTLNPVFDETLKFHISLNGLETRTLWLTVWHSDMFGRNDFLGEVMMTLENKVFDDPTPKLYNLQERTEPFDDTISFKGDIIVCLKFIPPDMTVQKKGKRSRGALHVLVKEAKYLTAYKANGSSDPFCKSYLLPDKGRNSKQKTQVMKKTTNPVWNHTFIYDDVTLQELAERCLELTVWDHDRLASNEFLGGVRFSLGTGKHYGKSVEWMDSTGKEISLWKSMLERPNFWVEGCLSLRPTLEARSS